MDVDGLIEKTAEESDLSEDDIKEKVEEKMEEFSGMVSEEGAVHLVAKEHGVQLSEASNDLKIENIVPEMRKVSIKGRVTAVLDPNTFDRDDGEEGKVQNIVIADETGSIRVTLWDEQTQIAEKVNEGDAVKISGCYTVEDNRGNAELRLGDEAQVAMADDDEVPEVETGGSGGDAEKAEIKDIKDENANYITNGIVVAVYTSNPFYRVDPDTGDTVRANDDGDYETDEGEVVDEPETRLAVSAVIDDGTGNTRCVFFREQARKLLDVDEETEKSGKQKKIEASAENALGKEITITGRTRYNDYFGQLEIIVNELDEFDASEEINELLDVLEA
ncbi:OB-fold nucleic acid binding domain-containing protein [Candidatus Nanohalococcus occultus]|uniref:Single-stranded DNA-binding replication protein A (RPA), large (70 kD) subunit or related ssDNA-binding protein n=1 Tax=Candidatus Nanohalococcus occultus TaxID=2978047 RepID=A0ABY8CEZ1_9ARCH|nr:Single-stranded DNA-binding replication protein A (RPA), large (70 kD) subunit or related ssDNA-binding protein [Candidatus Nanohaloarchaeota archaeon SVXNc]